MPKHHDSPRKNRFIGAVRAGQSILKAAKENEIPYSTARAINKKFDLTGSTHRRAGSGRPSKLDARGKRTLIKEAKKNRRKPLSEVGMDVVPQVSATTARRVLDEVRLHRRIARSVIFLRPEHKDKRRKWALDHLNWGEEDFERVVYSDEAYIMLGDLKGQVHVTRTPEEVYDEACVVPKFKQSSLRIMVWGCVMRGRKGPLVVLEYPGGRGGGMTAARYQEQVLDRVLHEFYMEMAEERGQIMFQQDGAPCHRAASTRRWLDLNSIEKAPHPPVSPDVNPIEPLWHTLKTRIRSHAHIPTSLDELKLAAKEAWAQISKEDIDKHVKSMEDRVRAVIAAKGGHTLLTDVLLYFLCCTYSIAYLLSSCRAIKVQYICCRITLERSEQRIAAVNGCLKRKHSFFVATASRFPQFKYVTDTIDESASTLYAIVYNIK